MLEVVTKAVVVHGSTADLPSATLRPSENRRAIQSHHVDLLCEMRPLRGHLRRELHSLRLAVCREPVISQSPPIASLVIGCICLIPPPLSSAFPSAWSRSQLAHGPGLISRRLKKDCHASEIEFSAERYCRLARRVDWTRKLRTKL